MTDYRFIQTEPVLAFGGVKPHLQPAQLINNIAAANKKIEMTSFVFILQI